ncbi:hypothetical protein [Massilia sp. TS11]|uniref:hypothetical protein n=1 Tax=Massilia sp. TS11 TaxID=2908003 RepID=UPI001EDC44DC|nr:hypothetical protein [Massilia sp. TS11]MCG2583671.1 hypothetical protein [Massilia sp. TS11]
MENSTQHGNGHDTHRQAATPSATEVADQAASMAEQAGHALSEKSRQLGDAYQRFAESGRECVRSSPATSVLVALLTGWALSRLFFRK